MIADNSISYTELEARREIGNLRIALKRSRAKTMRDFKKIERLLLDIHQEMFPDEYLAEEA